MLVSYIVPKAFKEWRWSWEGGRMSPLKAAEKDGEVKNAVQGYLLHPGAEVVLGSSPSTHCCHLFMWPTPQAKCTGQIHAHCPCNQSLGEEYQRPEKTNLDLNPGSASY